jgi:hypothetical protein
MGFTSVTFYRVVAEDEEAARKLVKRYCLGMRTHTIAETFALDSETVRHFDNSPPFPAPPETWTVEPFTGGPNEEEDPNWQLPPWVENPPF